MTLFVEFVKFGVNVILKAKLIALHENALGAIKEKQKDFRRNGRGRIVPLYHYLPILAQT